MAGNSPLFLSTAAEMGFAFFKKRGSRFRLILGVFGKMRAAANTEFRVIVGLIAAFSTNLTHALIVLLFAKKVNLIRLWNVRVL